MFSNVLKILNPTLNSTERLEPSTLLTLAFVCSVAVMFIVGLPGLPVNSI